ncbi:hypothetical protein DPMN_082066 [Dreissena polymorpha]|uniref:Uncharacterized protein n=1 Tax=Dreissena polymorpha TaxID=45954 RepID=A0A9D4B9S8_DREPO|nr:hypothetical protein DPMN_082066 [Dreissena polymorpha]
MFQTSLVRQKPPTHPGQHAAPIQTVKISDLACSKRASTKPDVFTRTFPGADIGSYHDLVLTTIKLMLKSKRITKNPCI